jgi:hypothetical protein
MKFRSKTRQRGLSFIGLLFIVGFIACAGVLAAQVFPTVVEYQAILKATQKAAAGGSVPEIRQIFERSQAIDDFNAVRGKDLIVTKNGDKVVVSFAYNKEIHMFGPAFLLIKYSGQSK